MGKMTMTGPAALIALAALGGPAPAEDHADQLPVVAACDFEGHGGEWRFLDPPSWLLARENGNTFLRLADKAKSYDPPHRSPHHIALLVSPNVTSFELTARVRSTHEDYGHRDACLFFGYQDAEHFYYAHLGRKTDDRSNQVFIVNGADRAKITTKTNGGVPWDADWHTVKVVRRARRGVIEVYFDNLQRPLMTAKDDTFLWGRVGVGSFDDTADFDDVRLRGAVPRPPVEHHDYPADPSMRR